MESLCLTFLRNCLTGFHSSSSTTTLYSHQQCRQTPVFPHLHFISLFKHCSLPSGCKVVLHCCFDLHFSVIGYVEHLFMDLLAICILSSFKERFMLICLCLWMYAYKCVHVHVFLPIDTYLEKILGILLNHSLPVSLRQDPFLNLCGFCLS